MQLMKVNSRVIILVLYSEYAFFYTVVYEYPYFVSLIDIICMVQWCISGAVSVRTSSRRYLQAETQIFVNAWVTSTRMHVTGVLAIVLETACILWIWIDIVLNLNCSRYCKSNFSNLESLPLLVISNASDLKLLERIAAKESPRIRENIKERVTS